MITIIAILAGAYVLFSIYLYIEDLQIRAEQRGGR